MEKNIIKVENLSFSYGDNLVLDDVSFNIEVGDFVGLIGPNGSAKSTLIKLILGLLDPDKGQIKILNQSLREFNRFGEIGFISQTVTDFNRMFPATVLEVVSGNIIKKGFIKRITKEDIVKSEEALKVVDMLDFKNRKIGNLSGGQKQRVFIARALVNDPKILIMDEPLVGVDMESQERFYSLMDKLNTDYKLTLIMVSHDIGTTYEKVNKILCLSNGKLYCHDSPKCECGEILHDIFGENMNILHHKH